MDLKIYKSKSIPNLQQFDNKLDKLNFHINPKDEVGVFSSSKINDNTYHIIFYIKEEYHTGTKYISRLNKVPMDVYISTFLLIDKNYLLIEKLYNEYFDLIIDKYKSAFNIQFDSISFENSYFEDLINNKVRKVLHCDVDNDGYIKSVENKGDTVQEISEGNMVDFITFTLESEKFSNITTSISKQGVVTSKANTPMMLINIIQMILEE